MGKKSEKKQPRVAAVAIGRQENRYAREWVEHYLKMGFAHLYICDNNRLNEEHFEDVLQDYIEHKKVTVLDYRDRATCILKAYTETYNLIKGEYDWIGVFDFDELLDIRRGDLQSFLACRKGDCVLVNWECYGDNGLTRYEDEPMAERFTKPLPHPLYVQYDDEAENDHVKSFVRGGLDGIAYRATPHVPDGCRSYERANGEACNSEPLQPFDGKAAVLRHYITKTAEEWVDKFRRGGCDRKFETWQKQYQDRFFAYNRRTKEKEKILNSIYEKVVAIVHYNTPELTEATIKSIRKHGGESYRIVIFDNSDERPFRSKMKGVEVVDNTEGQIINFDKELAKFTEKDDSIGVCGKCIHGSTKHTISVQKLWDLIPGGFLLMDSDILLKDTVDFMFMFDQCCCGHIQESSKSGNPFGIARLVPFLLWINVPMCVNGGARFFDPKRTWGLLPGGRKNRNNWYDTGASFLEDIRTLKPQCHGKRIDIRPLMVHKQSGSWNKHGVSDAAWLEANASLWK